LLCILGYQGVRCWIDHITLQGVQTLRQVNIELSKLIIMKVLLLKVCTSPLDNPLSVLIDSLLEQVKHLFIFELLPFEGHYGPVPSGVLLKSAKHVHSLQVG
jgi:hypothetical protein